LKEQALEEERQAELAREEQAAQLEAEQEAARRKERRGSRKPKKAKDVLGMNSPEKIKKPERS